MKSLIKKILREGGEGGRSNPRGGTKQNAGSYIGPPFKDLKKLNKYREDQLLSGEILTKIPDEVDITKYDGSGQIFSYGDDVLSKPRETPDNDYDPPSSESPLTPHRGGCTDPTALNYNPEVFVDDGSCVYDDPPGGPGFDRPIEVFTRKCFPISDATSSRISKFYRNSNWCRMGRTRRPIFYPWS